ncbi:MAG: hypothetical protein ACREEO_05810, partial [Phenylobacterium sp.]
TYRPGHDESPYAIALASRGARPAASAVLVSTATAAPDAVIVTALGAAIFFSARAAQSSDETFRNVQLVYPGEAGSAVYMVCVR